MPSKLLDSEGKWIGGPKPTPGMSQAEWQAFWQWRTETQATSQINPVVQRLQGGAGSMPTSGDFDRVFQRGSTYRAGTATSVGQESVKWIDCTPHNEDKTIKITVPVSVDWKRGCRQYLYLTENRNIYLQNPLDQTCCLLVWQRKAAGDATITFMDSFTNALYPKIYWMTGVAPTMTATLDAMDMLSFVYIADLKLYAGMYTQDMRVRTA
jgi:hypothetical protein